MQERFEDEIIFAEINGLPNVATFRMKAKRILHDFYKDKRDDTNEEIEKERIILTAAKLLKEDIKTMESDLSNYPDVSNM